MSYFPSVTVQPTLETFFSALQLTVSDLSRTGRRITGAGLLPELKRRSANGFNYAALGFTKFSDFVEAAHARGYVRLVKNPTGDFEVLPVSASPSYSTTSSAPGRAVAADVTRSGLLTDAPTLSGSMTIRQDLWKAFTFFNPGYLKYYDKRADKAFMFPEQPIAFEPPEISELRARLRAQDRDLVAIEAISIDVLRSFMRAFAETQEELNRQRLLNALKSPSDGHREFSIQARGVPGLFQAWARFHIARVKDYIEEWIRKNSLPTPASLVQPYVSALRKAGANTIRGVEPPADVRDIERVVDELFDKVCALKGMVEFQKRRHAPQG